MNIIIPDSWLREFVKTEATPKEVARALSLCSLSVDKVEMSTDGETIYHIEVPPNRYDCLSVIGVAREAVAVLPRFGHPAKLRLPTKTQFDQLDKLDQSSSLSLRVEVASQLCPHFAAIVIDQAKIKPSPDSTRQRLEKAGIRALNNVIDTTNYLMLETGQPMHAFDFDKLATSNQRPETRKMVLRTSRVGEWLVTLDGVKRQLPTGSIVIEDGEKLIDLCGIMGGENSAIDDKTQRVILFAQIYDPRHVRKTSMALPLRTEAAQRFEKGLDPEAVLPTLYQSVKMLQENASAAVASPLYNLRQSPFQPHHVTLRLEKLNQYLGILLPPKEICQILRSIGFAPGTNTLEYCTRDAKVHQAGKVRLSFGVPSWRDQDIALEEDLIEEVARIYGYQNLPTTLPMGEPAASPPEARFAYEHRLKFLLKDLGFTEVYTSSLVSKELAGDGELLRVTNPLGPETEFLKFDPGPTMVKVAQENLSQGDEVAIFEITNTYQPIKGQTLPKERSFLTVVVTEGFDREKAYLRIKGLIETIFTEFRVAAYTFKDISSSPYGPDPFQERTTSFVLWPTVAIKSGRIFGGGGLVKGSAHLWIFKIHLEPLWELTRGPQPFSPLPAHPPLIEEISFYLSPKISFAQAVETIKTAGGGLLKKVELTDHYTNAALRRRQQKSFTIKLTFANPQKTLESRELPPVREKIIKALQEKLGATVRAKVSF